MIINAFSLMVVCEDSCGGLKLVESDGELLSFLEKN